MNQAIASILKAYIEDLDFVEKIAGLVQKVTFKIDGVEKSFPVACCVSVEDCKNGAYNDLTPDSKYRSVIYFEDGGVSLSKYESNWKYYTSRLRLVGWLNVKMILGEDCGETCTYAAHAIADIIRHLPSHPQNVAPFDFVYPEITNEIVRSNSIFANYTYNELQTQYLMAPYDFFALDIQTNFAICIKGTSVYSSCDEVAVSETCLITGLTDDSGDIITS